MAVAIIDGSACGRMDEIVVWNLRAPTDSTASLGVGWACSIASAKSLPIMPIEWMAIARTPGNGPMLRTKTKSAARMISGTARVSEMNPRHTNRTAG